MSARLRHAKTLVENEFKAEDEIENEVKDKVEDLRFEITWNFRQEIWYWIFEVSDLRFQIKDWIF